MRGRRSDHYTTGRVSAVIHLCSSVLEKRHCALDIIMQLIILISIFPECVANFVPVWITRRTNDDIPTSSAGVVFLSACVAADSSSCMMCCSRVQLGQACIVPRSKK